MTTLPYSTKSHDERIQSRVRARAQYTHTLMTNDSLMAHWFQVNHKSEPPDSASSVEYHTGRATSIDPNHRLTHFNGKCELSRVENPYEIFTHTHTEKKTHTHTFNFGLC